MTDLLHVGEVCLTVFVVIATVAGVTALFYSADWRDFL